MLQRSWRTKISYELLCLPTRIRARRTTIPTNQSQDRNYEMVDGVHTLQRGKRMNKQPTTFKTQREAYWYRKGFAEAIEQMNALLDTRLKMYSSELLDHLPTGEEE